MVLKHKSPSKTEVKNLFKRSKIEAPKINRKFLYCKAGSCGRAVQIRRIVREYSIWDVAWTWARRGRYQVILGNGYKKSRITERLVSACQQPHQIFCLNHNVAAERPIGGRNTAYSVLFILGSVAGTFLLRVRDIWCSTCSSVPGATQNACFLQNLFVRIC
jgi:hypothetical protein